VEPIRVLMASATKDGPTAEMFEVGVANAH
jgi:hypothetical protein